MNRPATPTPTESRVLHSQNKHAGEGRGKKWTKGGHVTECIKEERQERRRKRRERVMKKRGKVKVEKAVHCLITILRVLTSPGEKGANLRHISPLVTRSLAGFPRACLPPPGRGKGCQRTTEAKSIFVGEGGGEGILPLPFLLELLVPRRKCRVARACVRSCPAYSKATDVRPSFFLKPG